jgi:hypothetical protein
MQTQSRDPAVRITGAALVTMLGGLVALLGSLLAWIQVGVAGRARGNRGIPSRRGGDVSGTSLVPGKVALVAGIVLIIVGLSMWIVRSGEARRALSVVAVVAGAVVLGAAIAAFQTEGTGLLGNLAGRIPGRGQGGGLGQGGGPGRLRLLAQLAPSHGPGLYLALTGGIVAVAGSVAGVFWTTVPVTAPPEAMSGATVATTQPFSKGRAA